MVGDPDLQSVLDKNDHSRKEDGRVKCLHGASSSGLMVEVGGFARQKSQVVAVREGGTERRRSDSKNETGRV